MVIEGGGDQAGTSGFLLGKQLKMKLLEQRQRLAEAAECSFEPKLNAKSRAMPKRGVSSLATPAKSIQRQEPMPSRPCAESSVYDRLHRRAQEREENLKTARHRAFHFDDDGNRLFQPHILLRDVPPPPTMLPPPPPPAVQKKTSQLSKTSATLARKRRFNDVLMVLKQHGRNWDEEMTVEEVARKMCDDPRCSTVVAAMAREAAIKRIEQKKRDRLQQQWTFAPELTANRNEMARRSDDRVMTGPPSRYDLLIARRKETERRNNQRRAQQASDQVKECTFQPRVVTRRNQKKNQTPVHDRLFAQRRRPTITPPRVVVLYVDVALGGGGTHHRRRLAVYQGETATDAVHRFVKQLSTDDPGILLSAKRLTKLHAIVDANLVVSSSGRQQRS